MGADLQRASGAAPGGPLAHEPTVFHATLQKDTRPGRARARTSGHAIDLAFTIAEDAYVFLVGIIGISEAKSLSSAALPARELRKQMRQIASKRSVRVLQRIRVSHEPWAEVLLAANEEQPDLLILERTELAVSGHNGARRFAGSSM